MKRQRQEESHNEEMSQFLSTYPGWIIRWGMTIIFIFILTFIFVLSFIKIPTYIEVNTIITPLYLPKNFQTINSEKRSQVATEETFLMQNQQSFSGKCTLSVRNALEIKVGQEVNLTFEQYSDKKRVQLSGRVSNKLELPNKDSLLILMSFPVILGNSNQNNMNPQKEIKGKVQIITKNNTFSDKILNSIRTLVKY